MQKYIDQLIEDLEEAAQNPPKVHPFNHQKNLLQQYVHPYYRYPSKYMPLYYKKDKK